MAVAPRLSSPTAMQNRAVAHETAARVRSCGTGVGRGIRSACQARPFQRAATGRAPAGPEPAAWQKPGTGHDTLVSGPAGGRGTTDHWVPVHASAGVPTARQEMAVAHDTPSSWLRWPRLRAGVASHARPFHRMAMVSDGPVAP